MNYAAKPCMNFSSNDLHQCILREIFKVLKAPPIEMLKSDLEASRSQKQTRLSWIESERVRLEREERSAEERADLTRGGLARVHFDALAKLERVLQEKKQFEQKIAAAPALPDDASDQELAELCRIARDVPRLWQHKSVSREERVEILRSLVDYIVVALTKDRIDVTIVWKTGSQTSAFIWRFPGRHHLINELHARRLTTSEIIEHLAAGRTSTGQVVNISLGRVYLKLLKLGLKANRFSARNISLAHKATELNRNGRSLEWIAQYFNQQGFPSTRGKSWTRRLVYELIARIGKKVETLGNLHHRAVIEARARGLTYRQMAIEFNERKIRRKGGRPWTALNVAKTCGKLDLLQHDLREGSTGTDAVEPPIVRRSA
jgi:hypothetical protein